MASALAFIAGFLFGILYAASLVPSPRRTALDRMKHLLRDLKTEKR